MTKSNENIAKKRAYNLKNWVDKHGVPVKEKSYFSQLISGSASFGEKAAKRLEEKYHMGDGYLDTPIPSVGEVKKPVDHLNDLMNGDPAMGLEAGLLKCFRGCKDEDRDLLLSIANKLYERAHPNDGTANPLNRRKSDIQLNKKEKNSQ